MIIPMCHVRYWIYQKFWSDMMPRMFHNNEMPAKAVFAHSVLGLYASKFWKGESGLGKGCPFAYIHSPEYNTGKSEAILAGHAMTGYFHRSAAAGDGSKIGLYNKCEIQADMTVAMDDYMPNMDPKSGFNARNMREAARNVYDNTDRVVHKKTSKCLSTFQLTVRLLDLATSTCLRPLLPQS